MKKMLNAFSSLRDFVVNLYYGDSAMQDQSLASEIRGLTKKLAKDYLPAIDFDSIEKYIEESKMAAREEELNPENSNNTDEIDNLEGF